MGDTDGIASLEGALGGKEMQARRVRPQEKEGVDVRLSRRRQTRQEKNKDCDECAHGPGPDYRGVVFPGGGMPGGGAIGVKPFGLKTL